MEKCKNCGQLSPSKMSHRCPSSNHDIDDAVDLVATVALGSMLFSSDDNSSSSDSSDSSTDFGGGDFGGGGSSDDW